MPISAEQWRALTGSAKVRKWSLAPQPGVKASSLFGNLSSTPPSDWKGYYSLMVLLCLPVLYKLYSVSMALVMYLVSGESLGTHGFIARASLHYHNILISVGGLTADISNSSILVSDGAWGGVLFLLLNGILYVAMVMTVLLFGVQEHRGRDKHQWKLTQQIHHLDLFWLNSGPECEVIVDTNTGRLYATLSMDSLGALQHVHRHTCTPCTSMKPKNSKTTFSIFLGILSSHFILQLSTLVLAMLLLLAGDVERNPGPVTFTMKDHPDVCHYLKHMDPKQLQDLGGTLGLHFGTLTKMNDLPAEMVSAWLRAKDSVLTKSGPPSWDSLIKALNVIGQIGIASTIAHSERKKLRTQVHLAAAVTPALPQPTVDPQPIIVQGKKYGKIELGVLKKNEDKIKLAFSHLVSQVLTMLMNLPVNMDVFRIYIAGVYPGILDRVPSTASVSDFFAYITDKQLWSYSNHSPIQSVAEVFLSDDPRTEELIDEYETKLAGYYATTSIVDYIALCKEEERVTGKTKPQVTLDEEFLEKLSVKLELPFTDETLDYISDLWKSLARIFRLPPLTTLLYCIINESGSGMTARTELAAPRFKSAKALRGVEVCAETTLIVTNSSQHFHWKGYGLTLHFPDGCLPADVDECSITIMASLAGQYEFPADSHLVSAVFWLRCEPRCKFTKAISVEIEHCALKENTSKLSIIRSHCTQEKLPYAFKKLGGSFTDQSSYGYIEVDSFSGLATTQDGSKEREYCAGLYYLEKTRLNPEIHFVIHWNTKAQLTHVRNQYKSEGAVRGPDTGMNFKADAISLDIPPQGAIVSGGWRLLRLTPLMITKESVDSFLSGRRIPHCEMQAIHPPPTATDDSMPVLTHELHLQGARQPFDSLTISFIPSSIVNPGARTLHSTEKPSLKDLLKELNRVADRWEDIGVFLDMDDGQLATVKANNTLVHACLREMLRLWLNRVSPPPSWAAVVEAIDSLGTKAALALELRRKYILP